MNAPARGDVHLREAAMIGVLDGWLAAKAARDGNPEVVAEFRRTLPEFWRALFAANPL